jgi:two-component system response regulator YesN
VADKAPHIRSILNLDELKKLFHHFQAVTGLDAALFDFSGAEILAERKPDSVCAAAKNQRKCRDALAWGGLMSSELGEPYIRPCGCGLVMCSLPVVFNETLIGSIACGPVILWDADELALSEFLEKTADMNIAAPIAGDSASSFPALLAAVPSCSCQNITSAAQIFFIMVNSLTREHSAYLRQRAQITEQQARIAELIIERKINAASLRELEKRAETLVYPVETEKELIALVQNGNKQRATHLLNGLLSIIFSFAEGNMDTIRVKLFELVAFLSRAAVEAGAPLKEVNGITTEAFEICHEDTDFERLCFLTARAMGRFIDTVYQYRAKKQASVHLAKAIEYIAEHYADELTLNSVAGAVYVSEFYLSHLFRREMNTTFSDYVCKVRIEKAKEFFMDDPSARIQEISDKTGFNDPNYFAKIFKKCTGMTPRAYHAFFK